MRARDFPNAVVACDASECLQPDIFLFTFRTIFSVKYCWLTNLLFELPIMLWALLLQSARRAQTPFLATVVRKCSAFPMPYATVLLYAQEERDKAQMCTVTRTWCLPAVMTHLIWRGRGGKRVWVVETVGKDVQDEMLVLVQKSFWAPKVIQQRKDVKAALGCLCLFTLVLVEHLLN